MYLAYLTFTALTIAYSIFSAGCDFVRYERVGVAMDRVGVPRAWMPFLGIPKAAAALGLMSSHAHQRAQNLGRLSR
jgi:hypothetical protein